VPDSSDPRDPDAAFLIWEDRQENSGQWWLTRARHPGADFFIAEDDFTGRLLVMVRRPAPAGGYKVTGAVRLGNTTLDDAIVVAKGQALGWLRAPGASPYRREVTRWRLHRFLSLSWRQLPLAVAAFLIGAALGFAVALFAVSTELVGWPMLVIGLALGAAAGPVLRFIADRKLSSGLGPWARFAVVTVSALLGAALTVGGGMMMFWD
jgi:hypothetical protein